MGRARNEDVIKELKEIKKKYHNYKFYLFGSRARNEELLTSDVDLIVISNNFKNINFRKRGDEFLDLWNLSVDLEVFCYSEDEFERKKNEFGIIRQASKEMLEI